MTPPPNGHGVVTDFFFVVSEEGTDEGPEIHEEVVVVWLRVFGSLVEETEVPDVTAHDPFVLRQEPATLEPILDLVFRGAQAVEFDGLIREDASLDARRRDVAKGGNVDEGAGTHDHPGHGFLELATISQTATGQAILEVMPLRCSLDGGNTGVALELQVAKDLTAMNVEVDHGL